MPYTRTDASEKLLGNVSYNRLEMSPRSTSESLSVAHQNLNPVVRPVQKSSEAAGVPRNHRLEL
jgi:hypothetical protein